MTVIHRIRSDQFIHYDFMFSVSNVIVHRYMYSFRIRVSKRANFAVFKRVHRFRALIVCLFNVPGGHVMAFQAAVRTVSIIVLQGLMLGAVRHGLTVYGAISVAASRPTMIVI